AAWRLSVLPARLLRREYWCRSSDPVSGNGIVLAQRVPFPVVGQHDAAQVGMVAEVDAEQVERLALEPVGRAPHCRDRVNLRIFAAQAAFEAQPLIPCD